MQDPLIVVRNYDLFETLGGAESGIVDTDAFLDAGLREGAQRWLESALTEWTEVCRRHTGNEDISQIFARMLYWPLLEIVRIIGILLHLKNEYGHCSRIRIYAPKDSFLEKTTRRLFIPTEPHWELKQSFGRDLRSRYEKRRIFLYPYQGPRVFPLRLRMFTLTVLSAVCRAMTCVIRNTDVILVIGESRFLPLIRTLRFLGAAAFGNTLKSFPFLAVPSRSRPTGIIRRRFLRCFDKLNRLDTPSALWRYRGIDISGIVDDIFHENVISRRHDWIGAVQYYESFLTEYKPHLITVSTIDSESHALAAVVANFLGIPCLGMLDGYLPYNTSTANTGFQNRPVIDWVGYCCRLHRESIEKAGVPKTRLIAMPSPSLRAFKSEAHRMAKYDVVIFSYFVTLTTLLQDSCSHGRFLADCLDTMQEMGVRNVLIKCRYDEETLYVRQLVSNRRRYFETIDIASGPAKKYYLAGKFIIGGISSTMMECAKSNGMYYVYEPNYGGMAFSRDAKAIRQHPEFAVTPSALTENIRRKRFFGASSVQRREYAIDIHSRHTEHEIWKPSISRILNTPFKRKGF